jgi:tryptophan-rich sensory protein
MNRSTHWIGLVVSILVCFAATGLGGLVPTPQISGWYAGLAKPTWTPPGWIFGPVWSCRTTGLLAVGARWLGLTLAFEILFGRFVVGAS